MKTQFRLAIGLLAISIFVAVGTYTSLWDLHFSIGPFFSDHWLSIIGGTYLLIFIVIFAYMKRYTAVNRGTLLEVHMFGNLLAFMFVSVHFAEQMGHAHDLGTGLAAYLLLVVYVATGFMMRFGLLTQQRESWRLFHVGLSLSLFIVVVIHALNNFGIL